MQARSSKKKAARMMIKAGSVSVKMRVFDVLLCGKPALTDLDIAREADSP